MITLKQQRCVKIHLKSCRLYVPDRHKTQNTYDIVILKNGGILMFDPDCYKSKKMCNKGFDNYAYALEFILDCFKNQKMCNKVVDTYPSAIQFVPECYKTQEMCVKVVDTCPFVLDSVSESYKSQEISDKVVFSKYTFMLKFCLDK